MASDAEQSVTRLTSIWRVSVKNGDLVMTAGLRSQRPICREPAGRRNRARRRASSACEVKSDNLRSEP